MSLKKMAFLILPILIAFTGCDSPPQKSQEPTSPKESFANLTSTDTTGQLMKEEDFWKIIDKSRNASNNNYQAQQSALKSILITLDANDIQKFGNTFTALSAAAYDWKLWGAAYVINGGCSDDCFDYFREYLIAHGRDKFYQTLKDPESCADWIIPENEDNWEGVQYAIPDAYKQKTGNELTITYTPKFELKGKPFDEETVSQQYPKLAGKFGYLSK